MNTDEKKDYFIKHGGTRYAGIHLILDLYGAERLNDIGFIEETLQACIKASGATLLHMHLHPFEPDGVSGVAVLAESHISVHTWPETGYAAFDVFMCGATNPKACIDIMREAFKPDNLVVTEHLRGKVDDGLHEVPFKWWRERDDEFGAALSLNARLLHKEQSPFQLIEIFDTAPFGRVLVLDGYVQASQADEFIYHEMAIHVPLLGRKHENANILIIGGGEGGAVREALKHDFVSQITMVEIDQRVVELSQRYLGVNGDYNDPRVNLIIGDAAAFVDDAIGLGQTYDMILLDLTEPVGPSAALFTEGFCQKLVKLVKKDGVIVDSDSLYLSRTADGTPQGSFLQEVSGDGENLLSVMQRTKLLPHIEVYHTKVPLYPGADFGFFLYSHHGESYKTPNGDFTGNHYNSAVHTAAFALPEWQKRWISS